MENLTPAALSDEALVRQLSLRDGGAGSEVAAGAGTELVNRHCGQLLRYLRRLAGSDHVAEELHQQTWTSVLEHAEEFDPSIAGGFKAWLYRIATNKANDFWRGRSRQQAANKGLRDISPPTAPAASERLETEEQCRKVMVAVHALPEKQRQVLLLRYYGNFKFVEIAQMLGCPLNTVLGRMHKAMCRLKERMQS